MGRPLRLAEVRGFEYLDIDLQGVNQATGERSANYFGLLTPVEPCARCGRPVEDLTRTDQGQQVEENVLDHDTFGHEPLCDSCIADDREAEFEEEVIELLEGKLGLAEKHRDALRSFIETLFTDPQKILQVKDLDNRVNSLERQNNIMWGIVGVLVAAVIALATLLVSVVV